MAEDAAQGRNNLVPLLPVRVRDVWLAVPALLVGEVLPDAEPLPLPRAPAHIAGLLNLRGGVLPVLDVGRFLGLPEATGEGGGFPRVVVVQARDMSVGLRCRAVHGVVPAGERPLMPPGAHTGLLAELATGEVDLPWGLATVIDVAALLEAARVRA